MYNKLASIILNSAKNKNYAGEVFISQPDAAKEKLAGKIFVLAELEGHKGDSQKIINFIINFFDYNYYGDEKILLRDKIEGLKIENIFEGVLARVNKGLLDFLQDEHFKINPQTTNITLGVVFENKLYFSNFGKNKAFLIFRRRGNYEIINVEASASDEEVSVHNEGEKSFGKIFSAVINGEIPEYSYFFFANEALPEYLTNKELVEIVTKLPPMVAAEQIKNSLQKINSFAPFLGIIIKSTLGLNVDASDDAEPARVAGDREYTEKDSRNAHSSISHLNYTERKTERMLAPAGIISLKKLHSGAISLLSKLTARKEEASQKVVRQYDNKEVETEVVDVREALARKNKLTHRESFAVNDKLVFKKNATDTLAGTIKSVKYILLIFSPSFWVRVFKSTTLWAKSLTRKNQVLIGAVFISSLVLIISIWVSVSNNNIKLAKERFQEIVNNVNGKQEQVDSYLLYGNENGALAVINEATSLLEADVTKDEEQLATKAALFAQLQEQRNKILKITEVSEYEETLSLTAWGVAAQADNIILFNNKLYLADALNKSVYNHTLADGTKNNLSLTEQLTLNSPITKNESVYYIASNKIVKITGNDQKILNIDTGTGSGQLIQLYKDYIYAFNPATSQVYRYSESTTSFVGKSVRLTGDELNGGTSFNIDEKGAIFIAKNNSLLRFFNGKLDSAFKLATLDPALTINKVVFTASNIYILDSNNSRLVSFDLNGALTKQYILDKSNLKDFTVDVESKSVYLLAGSSVYKFPL